MKEKRPLHIGRLGFEHNLLLNACRATASVYCAHKAAVLLLVLALTSTLALGNVPVTRAAIIREVPFSASLKSPSSGLPVPDGTTQLSSGCIPWPQVA